MSAKDEWNAISAHIHGLVEAATLHAQFLGINTGDPFGRAKYMRAQCVKVIDSLEDFQSSYEPSLPPSARSALSDFLNGPAQQIGPETGGHQSIQQRSWATLVKLAAFEAELSYCFKDTQSIIRGKSERAFVHLQRLIAVDENVQATWSAALSRGEVSCEKLGAAHLLFHGIWAFKVHAEGARTDLVYQEPLENSSMPDDAFDGLVLTEWKVARTAKEGSRKFEEAREQAERYVGTAVSGTELRAVRYAVVVSEQPVTAPSDVEKEGVSYRHINIATSPFVPSKAPRERA